MVYKDEIDGNTTLQAEGAPLLPAAPEPSYMHFIQQNCLRVQQHKENLRFVLSVPSLLHFILCWVNPRLPQGHEQILVWGLHKVLPFQFGFSVCKMDF